MIRRLTIENYRGFQKYALGDLARVNLLVGKNNSGKTSILEAVELLADGGNLRTLEETATRRGETLTYVDHNGTSLINTADIKFRVYPDISHFFHGHTIQAGSWFSLESDDRLESRRFEVFQVSQYDSLHKDPRFAPANGGNSPEDLILVAERSNTIGPGEQRPQIGILNEWGALDLRQSFSTKARPGGPRAAEEPSFLFIPQESLKPVDLARMWDAILTEGREDDVIQAMQILEPDLTSVAFLSGSRQGILLGFRGDSHRRPLGSYGEGMRRLLSMAVALAQTKGGVLLIDEVDTGLHYSVLGDVWMLIVEAAVRYDIQVFLTTHSLDCIRALGWLCGARPDLAEEVSVQKIERALDRAVAFDASQIQIVVEQNIEVR